MQKVKDIMTDEWITRLRRGDHTAFEELVHRLTPAVYKLAFSMMGNEHDASDAAQETFIKVFKALPHFRGDSQISTWVYRIAVNTCKDMLRSLGRYQVVSPDDENVFLQIPDGTPTPEDSVITKEQQTAVRTAVEELPTEYKLVISLCDLNGLSYVEAAQALSCPLGTVKSRLSRARTLLLKRLSKKRELFALDSRHTVSKEEPKR